LLLFSNDVPPFLPLLDIITTTIATTMPPKRARKAPAALIESIKLITAIPTPGITLGEEVLHAETDKLSPSSHPAAPILSLLLLPDLSNLTKQVIVRIIRMRAN
jgi:hypothetical protein